MTRDNGERLEDFAGELVTVKRLALNMEQVEHYKPPPNPAKLTDSRVNGYLNKYGYSSWELDALEPRVISDLVERAIQNLTDPDAWAFTKERQAEQRQILASLENNWHDVKEFLEDE